jgi:hypothetical protein
MRKYPEKQKEPVKKPERPQTKPDSHELPDACATACSPLATKRNRYYTGRYLTAHDFRLEQGYFLSRHRLHNRQLHGWGIVCGLNVEEHKNPNCANNVIIHPGIAIDCCGREIILERPQVVEVWDPDNPPQRVPRPNPPEEKEDDDYDDDVNLEQQQPELEEIPSESGDEDYPAYLITICYSEQESEFAPALYDDGSCGDGVCGSDRLEANRICETATLHVVPWDAANQKKYAGCWPGAEPQPHPCRDDCEAHPDMPQIGCLDPACHCKLCVPLALVRPDYVRSGYAIIDASLDFSGRKEVHTPPEYLTHIVDLNWPHGGSVPFSKLSGPEGMNGELRITFDRKLLSEKKRCKDLTSEKTAVGVNDSTVMVQIHRVDNVQYPLEIHHNDGHPPHLEENGCTVVIPLDDEHLEGRRILAGALLHITLRCDFVLDCHCRPVDGEHLRGTLPSGNGTQGGTFESWFWVTEDDEHYRRRRRRQN